MLSIMLWWMVIIEATWSLRGGLHVNEILCFLSSLFYAGKYSPAFLIMRRIKEDNGDVLVMRYPPVSHIFHWGYHFLLWGRAPWMCWSNDNSKGIWKATSQCINLTIIVYSLVRECLVILNQTIKYSLLIDNEGMKGSRLGIPEDISR